MGLVGLLATVAIMVVASWYMFAGPSSPSMTVENPSVPSLGDESGVPTVPTDVNTVSGAQALIGQAQGLKATLEQQAADISQQSTVSNEQGTGNEEQLTANLPTGQAGSQQITGTNQKKSETEADSGNTAVHIIDKKVSFGFSVSSGRSIDTVVLHSSYDAIGSDPYSVSGTIKEYGDYGVSPHYLIDRKGNIYRLVADKDTAYHAGESRMKDGRTGVNSFSIGIELLNKEDDEYTAAQYAAVNSLIAYLKDLYPIKYVVGHDDIAPGRKTDPWNFNWGQLK